MLVVVASAQPTGHGPSGRKYNMLILIFIMHKEQTLICTKSSIYLYGLHLHIGFSAIVIALETRHEALLTS